MRTIDLRNVEKAFGSVKAINGLNLSIQEGEVYALLGHNGAGKTTTLRLMLGLLEPDKGEVSVFGYDPIENGDKVRGMCGVLSEDVGLYEPLTVYDNLSYFAEIYGMKRAEYDKRIDYLLKQFEISDKKNLPVKNFSTGMKKKVGLIRALLHKPQILLLDEPTTGLDPVSTESLRNMLIELVRDNKTTIILTTHNLDEAQKICNRITILRHGCNVFTDTIDSLKAKSQLQTKIICRQDLGTKTEKLRQIFNDLDRVVKYEAQGNILLVDLKDKADVSRIIRGLTAADIDVENIETRQFSLENLYMEVESEVRENE